ncbi:MAG TPA: cell division protein FtsL [Terriglobia bacterium]|nr:cell division protein FtsL [Terriglobia bacterium]
MNEIYFIKTIDNSRWVPPPNPREPRFQVRMILAAGLLLAMGLLFAGERFKSREYGYQIERLEREKAALVEAGRKLRLEEASLADPLRIDSIARRDLGMTSLSAQQIFTDRASASEATVLASQHPLRTAPPPSRNIAAALP